MPVHTRRYFQFVEKDSVDVNPLWKVLHAIIFVLIMVMSFGAAFTFHDIFDSFRFQCILYCKPVLQLTEISYHEPNISSTQSDRLELTTTPENYNLPEPLLSTMDPDLVTEAVTQPPKEEMKVDIIYDEFWVSNSTMTAKVAVDFRETVFGAKGTCNAVLFFPLASFIMSTFAAVIVMICGRGGKGYKSDLFLQPWIYVYPLLALSVVILIANAVIVSWLRNGMTMFCSGFRHYTKNDECSLAINYFTDEYLFGVFNLYQTYNMCLNFLYSELILWALQVLLMGLRVICVADFQMNIVTVACNRRHSLEYSKDPVSDAMRKKFAGLRQVALVGENYYEDDFSPDESVDTVERKSVVEIPHGVLRKIQGKKKVSFQDDESQTSSDSETDVHDALMKSHPLKTVSFVDEQKPKEDDDDDVTSV